MHPKLASGQGGSGRSGEVSTGNRMPDPRAAEALTAEHGAESDTALRSLRVLALTIKHHAHRTTLHGLLHIFHSSDIYRQIFWLLLLVAAVSVGMLQTIITAQKFLSNPVTSQLRMMSEKATFPDVTICSLKPGSEALLSSPELRQYFNDKWLFFDHWYPEERKRRPGEDKIDFHERLRGVFGRCLQIFWVSGDSRDIGILDHTLLLHCNFNGLHCNHENLSLIQHHRFWNCYTFHVDPLLTVTGVGGRGAELEIIAFTDGFNQVKLQSLNTGKMMLSNSSSSSSNNSGSIYRKSRAEEERTPFSLSEYMDSDACINQLTTGQGFEPGGLRIFIHDRDNYPTLSREFLDVQSGSSSKITLRPIWHSLLSGTSHKCAQPPYGTVNYTRYFGHGSTKIGHKKFSKTDTDFVVEAKQQIIHDNCRCYSHRYPFVIDNTQLCYYVPPDHWQSPPASVLANIACHDLWILEAEKRTFELMQSFYDRKLCQFTLYRPWEQSGAWPRNEDVMDIWQDLIVPQIMSSKEFTMNDTHKHHIFNRSGVDKMTDFATRAELVYMPMMISDSQCLEHFCGSGHGCNLTAMRAAYPNAGVCVRKSSMVDNIARIRISLLASTADAYVEERSYDWTEALSETGGILGLWVGVSLLIIFELLEFICSVGINLIRYRPGSGASGTGENATAS